MINPRRLIGIGIGLMLLGAVLPFLMVMHLLPSTFFLNFFSYGCQVLGLLLGMIGVVFIVQINRRPK